MNTIQAAQRKKDRLVLSLRDYRLYHKYLGLILLLLLIISSATGLLLGWKKDIDLLQPPTQEGQTTNINHWASLASMANTATAALDSATGVKNNPIDRIEARPKKGMVKVLFTEGYWEVQLDGSTGTVLSVARRHSDWIEKVHDGSIVSDFFKLITMNVLGLGLLLLTATGFTLWLYPKRIRRLKNNSSPNQRLVP